MANLHTLNSPRDPPSHPQLTKRSAEGDARVGEQMAQLELAQAAARRAEEERDGARRECVPGVSASSRPH